MQLTFVSLRLPLYVVLWLFSFLLLALAAARLNYTTHLPNGDPLDGGRNFYDPIVAELLVCSLLSLGLAPFILGLVQKFLPDLRFPDAKSEPLVEIVALSILWLLWLIGAAESSSIWPNLSWCQSFEACRILSAMMAFAWLGWITICVLLAFSAIPLVQSMRGISGDSASTAGMHTSMHERGVPPIDNMV